jgi:hypothetical protein
MADNLRLKEPLIVRRRAREPMPGEINGSLLDAQQVVGNLLDALRDGPAVHRLAGNVLI